MTTPSNRQEYSIEDLIHTLEKNLRPFLISAVIFFVIIFSVTFALKNETKANLILRPLDASTSPLSLYFLKAHLEEKPGFTKEAKMESFVYAQTSRRLRIGINLGWNFGVTSEAFSAWVLTTLLPETGREQQVPVKLPNEVFNLRLGQLEQQMQELALNRDVLIDKTRALNTDNPVFDLVGNEISVDKTVSSRLIPGTFGYLAVPFPFDLKTQKEIFGQALKESNALIGQLATKIELLKDLKKSGETAVHDPRVQLALKGNLLGQPGFQLMAPVDLDVFNLGTFIKVFLFSGFLAIVLGAVWIFLKQAFVRP